jgi:hypothetical protein
MQGNFIFVGYVYLFCKKIFNYGEFKHEINID